MKNIDQNTAKQADKVGGAPLTLDAFYRNSVGRYVEPHRKGTPKGDPIGFSKQKYRASLLMMTNRRKYKIADDVGVSYQLLRKWGTERRFKDQILQNCGGYAHKIFDEMKSLLEIILQKQFDKWMGDSSPEETNEDPLSKLQDAHEFSDQLNRTIMNVVGESIHGYKDLWIALRIEEFFGRQEYSLLHKVKRDFQNMMSEDLKALSAKQTLSEGDRQKLAEIGFYIFLFNNMAG